MLWLYLYFPNLQLDVLFTDPGVEGPHASVVVLEPQQNRVVQLSSEALAKGIQEGMSLGSAAALDRHLQVLPYQPELEEETLKDIADRLYLITSDICFFASNGLLLRIHPMLHLYRGIDRYWQAVQEQLLPLNLRYHFATGQSPLAAKMLAQTQWDTVTQDRTVLNNAIGDCDLNHTDLSHKVLQKLKRVGIQTLAELLNIPLSDMARRFDLEVVNYLGKLTGELKHPIAFYHPEPSFERQLELLYEITQAQTLLRPLSQLLDSLEQFLKHRDLLCFSLVLTMKFRETVPLSISVGSPQGEYLAAQWHKLIALTLENLHLTAPVTAIALFAEHTRVRTPDKADLFAPARGTLTSLQLVAVLRAKLGEQAVYLPTVGDDYRPEHAQRFPSAPPDRVHLDRQCLQRLRPSFLFSPPRRLSEKVSIKLGPERIDTGWWDGKPVKRDYFIGLTEQGQWYWLFKTPQHKWYVHGLFS